LPAQVAAWLIKQTGWDGIAPLDLSDRLVVVPTRQSGRRLREALAIAAEVKGQAVFAPLVIVPEELPALVTELPETASRDQALVAWIRVLLQSSPRDYRTVFPVDPPRRDEAWARRLAQRFCRVQAELASGGLRMADGLGDEDMPESVRWQELAALEQAFDAVLAEQQVCAPVAAYRKGLQAVRVPAEIRRVVMAGCPDPNAVAVQCLASLVSQVSVEILAYGPDGETRAFDPWGRPRVDYWSHRDLALPAFEEQVQLGADPAQQAKLVAARAMADPRPEEWLALAVVDPEITAPLTRELEDRGQAVFHPEGDSWQRGSLYGLLQALATLVVSSDCRAIGNLLRCPAVLAALADEIGEGFSGDNLLQHWDRVREKHLDQKLPQALAHAGTFPILQQALAIVTGWVETLQRGEFEEVALTLPAAIMGERKIASDGPVADAARRWVEVVARVSRAVGLKPDLSHPERWQLALDGFGEGARFGSRPAGAIEIGGWLEVLWTDAPRLVIAGANDGRLPEAVSGDAFLPEALREQLGLKSNAQRLAADAYLMAAAVASRPEADDVLILVGKTAASGEPLRPSRILMAGDDEILPARVKHLFQPLSTAVDNLPWRRAWKLRPRRVKMKSSISVTGLRDWLECPFRFYLKRGLKMQEIALPKTELDAMDFGTLMHAVLEEMGQDPVLRDTKDEAALRDGMLSVFESRIRRDYGEAPSLPLLIQFESARQRLRRAATIEIAEREAGWKTERVEWSFEVPLGPLTITGKIDRIDRHEDGRVRVIDYKTSDKAAEPLAKHLGSVRDEDEGRPDWLRVNYLGKDKRWIDLQLPLYRLALAEEFGSDLTCAYFNLPKAVGETGISQWPDDAGDLQAAAEACAAGVAEAIGTEDFWPPVERISRFDESWAKVFHHGITDSVDESWIQQEGPDE
jgi:ATP-dependent helicase/nuclease subunit B